jgi:hypothetical protein
MFSHTRLIGCICASAVLCGCTTPKHTDLLVFGTNTQFGIDVGTNASSTTSLTIGFKRQEAVLMPLLANGQDSLYAPKPASAIQIDPKYLGQDSPAAKSDTYSVLAVFGATGSADTTSTAHVGIAQYFATGLAARTLAIAGGSLVNTGNGAAEASKVTATAAAKLDPALEAIHTTPVDALIAGAPLDQAYLNLKATKESIFNAAVQPMFTDYPDFSGHRTTIDQITKVKTELEKDADIKAEIEKDTPKK